jgi:hypothetical protein
MIKLVGAGHPFSFVACPNGVYTVSKSEDACARKEIFRREQHGPSCWRAKFASLRTHACCMDGFVMLVAQDRAAGVCILVSCFRRGGVPPFGRSA